MQGNYNRAKRGSSVWPVLVTLALECKGNNVIEKSYILVMQRFRVVYHGISDESLGIHMSP